MKEKFIIVLGSGSQKIPDEKSHEIYSSNGSAELAAIYKKKYNDVKHTCIIGARAFLKLDHVKPRVIKAKPDRIIIRDYEKISFELIKNLFSDGQDFLSFKRDEQFNFQKEFFKSGFVDLIKAEIKYENRFFKKIIHFYKFCFSNEFLGVSSGFFAILHAIKNHPKKKILVSGISFEGGNHYYRSGMMSYNRGRVDNYLVKKLKSEIKNKIYVLDETIALKYGLNYINLKSLF